MSRSTFKPSSRACLSCRSKHLRCDGENPKCARCSEAGDECTYVRSRRGVRKDNPKTNERLAPASFTWPASLSFASISSHTPAPVPTLSDNCLPPLFDPVDQSPSGETRSTLRRDEDEGQDEYLIATYYHTVHPAHPFLLPYHFYQQDQIRLPDHLLCAMRYIASHYTSTDPEPYRRCIDQVYDSATSDDVFKVQTLLLLTLTSYARFERDLGNRAFSAGFDTALKIGLNSNDFAPSHHPVMQESWRRTWWELFIVSGLISLISGSGYTLPLPEDMILPTHDNEYEQGNVTLIGSNVDMQQRFLVENVDSWSSFAYRIEAMRILNYTMTLSGVSASDNEVEAAQASITSFLLSLSEEKAEGLMDNGEVDEVMSCALMIIHLANIVLHIGRSDLSTVRGLATVCGTDRGRESANVKRRTHRNACLNAAKALANLLAMRNSLSKLSPCFSCAIAFAAVVQLAECRLSPKSQARYVQEQLKMQLSTLKSLGKIWPIANVVRAQLAQFSREIFTSQSVEPTAYIVRTNLTQELWMQDLLDDSLQIPSDGLAIPSLEPN